jgi:hypothetical protein
VVLVARDGVDSVTWSWWCTRGGGDQATASGVEVQTENRRAVWKALSLLKHVLPSRPKSSEEQIASLSLEDRLIVHRHINVLANGFL